MKKSWDLQLLCTIAEMTYIEKINGTFAANYSFMSTGLHTKPLPLSIPHISNGIAAYLKLFK